MVKNKQSNRFFFYKKSIFANQINATFLSGLKV
jgi:hypothetical protein